MKLFEDQLFFYGVRDILSNMYPVEITVDGKTYPSSEHIYVLMKCLSANDFKTADKVFKEKNPFEVKKIGYGIQGLDPIHWDDVNYDVMTAILTVKFSMPGFKEILLKSEGLQLIEGSPSKVWGCGIHINEIQSRLESFPGNNKCGNAMMEAREIIKSGISINPDTIKDLL